MNMQQHFLLPWVATSAAGSGGIGAAAANQPQVAQTAATQQQQQQPQKLTGSLMSHQQQQQQTQAWLPDGYSQIFRTYVFGPSGFFTIAPLRYAAKFDPFLSLVCAPKKFPQNMIQLSLQNTGL